MNEFPQFIAICGYPNSGKTTIQNIMKEKYGVIPVDDGGVLREIAMKYFSLSWADVHTQEGKLNHTTICGKKWQNRDILGTLGNKLEEMFGDQALPWLTLNRLNIQPGQLYSFGSVRKNQGITYKKAGGIVIEMVRPGCSPNYEFDKYDKTLVDFSIFNDNIPTWKTALEIAVTKIVDPVFHKSKEFREQSEIYFDVV